MLTCVLSSFTLFAQLKTTFSQPNMSNNKLSVRLRIIITTIVTLLVFGHLLWDYFHGGIPTHYLLHDKDLPGIPNWWGALVLPFFTWFLLYRIHKRIDGPEISLTSEGLRIEILRFFVATLVAISIGVCFMNGIDVIEYIMGSLFILAFFFPLYKSEYLLGWVLGSVFTFGAIIPIAFGSIFALLFFIFYKVPRGVINYFQSKKV